MKILLKAFYIYFLGIYIGIYAALFNMRVRFLLKQHRALSDFLTINMSLKYYRLQTRFKLLEQEFKVLPAN